MPTICHNSDYRQAGNKLYLYKNLDSETPLFHCYTECSETFNVYQLIQKRARLEGTTLTFREAYILLHGAQYITKQNESPANPVVAIPKFQNPLTIHLPKYETNILEIFGEASDCDPWHLEGVDLTVLQKFGVVYSKSYQGVVIPHLDWRGELIGIRMRTFDPIKEAKYKYMPLLLNNIYHRHPTSMNFYGLFQNQENIRKYKKVIIFEGEKSVLHYGSMVEDNISLAVCGKNISQWHINMLIYYLKVEEVIIGFDKETDFTADFGRVKEQTKLLSKFVKVGVLIDNKNIFLPKESPVDRTKKDFEQLSIWYV